MADPRNRTERRAAAVKKWCGTYFFEDNEAAEVWAIAADAGEYFSQREDKIKAMVCQVETCPTTSRLHLQWAVWLTERKRLRGLQEILGFGQCHCEVMMGTWKDNDRYCSDSTRAQDVGFPTGPWRWGQPPKEGKASLMARMVEMDKQGKSTMEMIAEEPALLMHEKAMRFLHKEKALAGTKPWRRVEVEVFIGPPGTKKTRTAYEENGGALKVFRVVKLNKGSLWWDGYGEPGPNGEENHEVILIDDFDSSWSVNYRALLIMLDGYPVRLPVKGSFTYARWRKVIITSNVPIDTWYPEETDIRALKRRITRVRHFRGVGELVELQGRAGMGHPLERVVEGSGPSGTGTGTGGNTSPQSPIVAIDLPPAAEPFTVEEQDDVFNLSYSDSDDEEWADVQRMLGSM